MEMSRGHGNVAPSHLSKFGLYREVGGLRTHRREIIIMQLKETNSETPSSVKRGRARPLRRGRGRDHHGHGPICREEARAATANGGSRARFRVVPRSQRRAASTRPAREQWGRARAHDPLRRQGVVPAGCHDPCLTPFGSTLRAAMAYTAGRNDAVGRAAGGATNRCGARGVVPEVTLHVRPHPIYREMGGAW